MSEDIVSSFKIPLKKKKVITERGVLQLTASSMARAKRKTERITIKESDKKTVAVLYRGSASFFSQREEDDDERL